MNRIQIRTGDREFGGEGWGNHTHTMIYIIVNSIMKNENDFPLLRIFLNQTRRVCSASPGFSLCPCFGVLLHVYSLFRLPNFSRLVTLGSHPGTNKNTKKTKNRRPWLCWPAVVECLVSGLVNTFSYLPCGGPTNRKLLKDLRGADGGWSSSEASCTHWRTLSGALNDT